MAWGDAFKSAWNKATDTARNAAAALATGAKKVKGWAKEKYTDAKNWTKKKATETADWVKKKTDEVKEWAKKTASDVWDATKSIANKVKNAYQAAKDYTLPKKVGTPVQHCLITQDKDNELIDKALASGNPQAIKLANKLKELNYTEEMAWLAKDVYKVDSADAPPGWEKLNADPEALAKLGLKPDEFAPKDIGFRAALYQSKDKKRIVFAVKGTESGEDWIHNLKQGIGMQDEYYEHTKTLAKKLQELYGDKLEITGHSLGGGMASTAGVVTSAKTTVFNPAGVHPNTIKNYDISQSDIEVYQVQGEILTTLQENREKIIPALTTATGYGALGPKGAAAGYAYGQKMLNDGDLPEAIGNIHKLPASEKGEHYQWKLADSLGYNPAEGTQRHYMESVLHSIQDQQQNTRQELNALISSD
jgi:gas vesicle protein